MQYAIGTTALVLFEAVLLIPRLIYWGAIAGIVILSTGLFTAILSFVMFDLLIQSGF